MAKCEWPGGCSDDATHRLVVRFIGHGVTTYEHYCRRHAAAAERDAERDDRFRVLEAGPY